MVVEVVAGSLEESAALAGVAPLAMADALRRLDESGLVAATHATLRTLHPPARVVREAKARALFAAMKSRVSAA